MKNRNRILLLDRTGITASIACAIHCAALPLIATLLPLWGLEFLANPFVEFLMLSLSVVIGFIALFSSYRTHHQKLPIILLLLGFTTIAFGHYIENTEAILIPLGGLLIAAAHLFNIKAHKNFNTHQHLRNENI